MHTKHSKEIARYLESSEKVFLTKDFGYKRYNSPNTTYVVDLSLDDLLLTLDPYTVMFWHKCLSLMKRSKDPVMSCSVFIQFKDFSSIMKRSKFFSCRKSLLENNLLIVTSHRNLFIVNVQYANKLYNPKFVPEDDMIF